MNENNMCYSITDGSDQQQPLFCQCDGVPNLLPQGEIQGENTMYRKGKKNKKAMLH